MNLLNEMITGIFLFLVAVLSIGAKPLTDQQSLERRVRVAVVDFGDSNFGRVVAEKVAGELKASEQLEIVDRTASKMAAQGAGYSGSLNLSITEARDLGAAIGCDFYLLGDAQLLRRSKFEVPVYFEAYAAIFLVSSRSGKLLRWERESFEAQTPEVAESNLVASLRTEEFRRRYLQAIQKAAADEKQQRELSLSITTPVIEEAPEDDKMAEASGLRLPRPYRRLRPKYPDSAARADVEAIVDVLVDLDAQGEVSRVDIARWAGFGLDEASLDTVRQLHFFPALRGGTPVPIRVLVRYNFRKSTPGK